MEKEINYHDLATVCGAVYYTITRYNRQDIEEWNFGYLENYLHIEKSIFCLEKVFENGFILTTKEITVKYFHNEFHDRRVLEISSVYTPN